MKRRESTYSLIGIAVAALVLVMTLGVGNLGGVMAQISIIPPPTNLPPTVTVDQLQVTVDEGDLATNSGTATDTDGSVMAVGASVGDATASNDTWSWSWPATDGPDNQQVTIEATDDDGATSGVTFDLYVKNVAPDLGPIVGPTAPAQVDTPLFPSRASLTPTRP